MPREDHDGKARRYLAESRLTVLSVNGDTVTATCRGAGTVRQLGHDPARGWWCTCPARTACSHLAALQLVTVTRNAA